MTDTAFRLGEITVENFKSWRGRHTVNLAQPPGVYFIAGQNQVQPDLEANGAGKSTFFADAVFWAFTGRTIRAARPGGAVEPWQDDKCVVRVEVEFFRHGPHKLVRQRRPNALILDDTPIDQAVLYKLVGLSDEALRRTLIIGQFGTLFLDLEPGDQARLFNDTLNLDRWLKAADLAGKQAVVAQTGITTEAGRLQGLEVALGAITAAYRQAAAAEGKYEEERKTQIDAELALVAVATSDLAKAEAAEFTPQQAAAIESAMLAAESAKQALVAFEAAPAVEKPVDLGRVEGELAAAREGLATLGAAPAPAPAPTDEIARVEIARAECWAAHQRVDAEHRGVGVLRATELARKAAAGRLVATYAGNPAVKICPECGQTVSDAHWAEKRRAAQHEVEQASTALANLDGKITHLEAQVAAKAADLRGFDDQLSRLRDQERTALLEANRHSRELSDQTAVVARLEARLNELIMTDKFAVQRRRDELGHAVAAADTAVDTLCEKIAAELEAVKAAAAANLAVAQHRLGQWQKAVNPHTALCEQQRQRLLATESEQAAVADKLHQHERQFEQYKYWATGFKEIRLKLIDDVLLELEVAANRHAEELGLRGWRVQFATERETQAGTISRGFTTLLWPPDFAEPVPWESYSGGEAQRWQLAAAFALAEVLLGRGGVVPNIEVLDEPTQHLSQQGIDDLLAHLNDRAVELGRAIYFIDHRALDRGSFAGVLTVVKDAEGSHLQ